MDQLFLPATEANTGEKIKSNGFQKSRIQGFTGNNREFSPINYCSQQYQGVSVFEQGIFQLEQGISAGTNHPAILTHGNKYRT
jgi:hypothetical protein